MDRDDLMRAIHGEDVYQGLDLLPADLQGWNSDAPLFRELIEETRPTAILELGSWKGASAIHMAGICRELGLRTTVVCVDTWLGAEEFIGQPSDHFSRGLRRRNGYPQVYYQFLSNVVHAGLQDYVVPFPQTSTIACRWLWRRRIRDDHQAFDLAYVDGSHEHEDVAFDIQDAKALLRSEPGRLGRLFGDDYGGEWPGVRVAVSSEFPDDHVQVVGQQWVWIPPANPRPRPA